MFLTKIHSVPLVPGTVLGSGDIRMKRCNFCFQGAYRLKVETDMQTNVQYNTVKCFHGGIYKVQWEFGRGRKNICLEKSGTASQRRWPLSCDLTSAREFAIWQAGKGDDRCKDTEAQGALRRSRWCGFSWAEGAVGTVAGWARQVGR